jgi:hypothetical protein
MMGAGISRVGTANQRVSSDAVGENTQMEEVQVGDVILWHGVILYR